MENEHNAYFCPNCRSNRVKFSRITQYAQRFFKDAVTGEICNVADPVLIEEKEPTIQCLVCSFVGNELRFIKQAEREPRSTISTPVSYT